MQANGRENRRGKFGKIALSALGALALTASSVWAVPFTGTLEGTISWTPLPDSNGSVGSFVYQGFTTTHGAVVCQGALLRFEFVQEPTGVCGEEEVETEATHGMYCQFEGTEDILNAIDTSTSCTPLSCYDENFTPQAGCSSTIADSTTTVTGGTGIFEDSSGSWTSSGTGTFTQGGRSDSGAFFYTSRVSLDVVGDIELADGSTPPARVALDIPAPGTNVSGVGLVSGWSCLGGELEVEFSDAEGVILTQTVLQGTEREDTEGPCGDINNGFSSLFNWNRLGSGERTARLIRNGEAIASSTFMVTALSDTDDFVTGVEGMCTIEDFYMGQNATFVWEQGQQGLVLESVN